MFLRKYLGIRVRIHPFFPKGIGASPDELLHFVLSLQCQSISIVHKKTLHVVIFTIQLTSVTQTGLLLLHDLYQLYWR